MDGGEKKIEVIKVVRQILAMGLKESKDLVYSTPALLKEGVTKEAGQTIVDQIKAAGGVATLS